MLHKLIYKTGEYFRNPSLREKLAELKVSETYTYDSLLKKQIEDCRNLLIFARKSPYYDKIFQACDFIPEHFADMEDLKRLPVLEKRHIRLYGTDIHTDHKFGKCFLSETSGTSGEPITFLKNEEWDSANRATIYRGYSWHDVNPWELNGYFWGYDIDVKKRLKTRILDFLQNRFRIFSYDDENIRRFIAKLKNAAYLEGYSSMIYEVAKLINQQKVEFGKHLKMIKGTSEKIHDFYQSEVKKAFGRKMISEYGAAEAGIIAFECPCGNMHINMEGCIVEEENDEIIVTNLYSYSFPVILYKLGDYVKLAPVDRKCPCGMHHPIIEEVTGRIGKTIKGRSKNYPSLTLYYVCKNIVKDHNVVINYQAIQNTAGHLLFLIEQEYTPQIDSLLKKECFKYFIDDMDIKIKYGQVLLHNRKTKRNDFISTL